ncbi:hypothetical protein JCM33374_g4422 [Metschnikowia sp. JCM 33374]|nr:hypothetical protein JCM33374_g4422 [Metschnikowia sp. JCM 33374]
MSQTHVSVTSPNTVAAVEVPDEHPHKYLSYILQPLAECADQSETNRASRRSSEMDLEEGRDSASSSIAGISSMGLETSRTNTNSDITGRVAGPTQPVTIDLTDSEIESERVPLVHVDENGINHTSLVSNASGSHAQDDGHDCEGIPQMVDEILFDSATQPGRSSGVSVHEVGKLYSGTSGNEASGVPCDGNTVGSSQYGVNQPSAPEPIQSKGIPTSDIRHEPSEVTEGNTNVYSHRSRCGREVGLPERLRDNGSNQKPKRKTVSKKFCDRNKHDVDTQELKRINNIKMKHNDVEAWKCSIKKLGVWYKVFGIGEDVLKAWAYQSGKKKHASDSKKVYILTNGELCRKLSNKYQYRYKRDNETVTTPPCLERYGVRFGGTPTGSFKRTTNQGEELYVKQQVDYDIKGSVLATQPGSLSNRDSSNPETYCGENFFRYIICTGIRRETDIWYDKICEHESSEMAYPEAEEYN